MKAIHFLTLSLALPISASEYELLTTNGMNLARSASHDGRFVALTTWSSLRTEDTNELADVYVYDRLSQSMILASLGASGFTGYGSAGLPLISSNGNIVAFEHSAKGLGGASDTRTLGNVYVRRVSENQLDAIAPGTTGTPRLHNISRDGNYTYFNFDTAGFYRRDNEQGTNQLVSSTAVLSSISEDGQRAVYLIPNRAVLFDFATGISKDIAAGAVAGHTLSGDGQVVVSRTSLSSNFVIQYLSTSSSNSVPIATSAVSLSADGAIIAFDTRGYMGKEPFGSVGYFDSATGTTNLISTRAGTTEPANGWSGSAVVSRDGRFIAFESWATDLVANDTNETKDIFLYDRLTKTLKQINATNGPAMNPFFSDDSATLFFHNGKPGGAVDIYAMSLDNFRIRAIALEVGGARRLFWNSRPNARYQVEAKQSLDEPNWIPISAETTSAGSETSATDADPGTTRFYRIRAL